MSNQFMRKFSIGSNSIDASSLLDINSTTKGTRPFSSVTEAERDAITAPVAGLGVYNTTTDKHNKYNGTIWTDIGSQFNVVSKTTAYTAVAGDLVKVDATTGAFTVTLPTASSNTDAQIGIIKTDATVNGVTFNGVVVNFQNDVMIVVSDGTSWLLLHDYLSPQVQEIILAADYSAATPSVTVWQVPNTAFKLDLIEGVYNLNLQGLFGVILATSTAGNQITSDIALSTSTTPGSSLIKTFTGHHGDYSAPNYYYELLDVQLKEYVVSSPVSIQVHFRFRTFSGSPTITSLGFRSESGSGNGTDPILTAERIGR